VVQHRPPRHWPAQRVLCGNSENPFSPQGFAAVQQFYFTTDVAWGVRNQQKSPKLVLNLLRKRLRATWPAKPEGAGSEMAA
jgi:hypothetical protein